jgi:glycosyltransferase involved in cell wall biosynthesis
VSVLVTTYNGAKFIGETIDCVLRQTFGDFELVVVDDCSTDATPDLLAGFQDPRIRICRTPRNLGVVGARNHGYRVLRGDYVATLDHDDLWRPTRLERGVALLDANPKIDFVGTRVEVLRGDHIEPTRRLGNLTPMLLRWMFMLDCFVIYSSLLFRRTAALCRDGGFLRPDLCYADDYELMLRLAFAGDGAWIDRPLTVYRMHGGNTTESVRSEMDRNGDRLRAEVYARWLGDDAARAAALIGLLIARRRAASSLAELDDLAEVLLRLLDGFLATYRPAAADRRLIDRYTRAAYWRTVRAAVRQGRVWLLGCYRRHRPLSVLTLCPRDAGLSLAAGLLRLILHPGLVLPGGRPPGSGAAPPQVPQ